jgi:phosphate-selective porin OprO/OprP
MSYQTPSIFLCKIFIACLLVSFSSLSAASNKSWQREGLSIVSPEGDTLIRVIGKVHLDYNEYDGVINQQGEKKDEDLFFRRARLGFVGGTQDWNYNATFELTEHSPDMGFLFISYTGWGDLAHLTLGQQKEYFGLEDTTSSSWITGIERSLATNAFDTGNNVGLKLHGANASVTYSIGVYKDRIDSKLQLDEAYTARFVYRPVFNEGYLIHLGAGYTYRKGQFSRMAALLGVRGGEDRDSEAIVAGLNGVSADTRESWNIELALSDGPLSLSGEYFDGKLSDIPNLPDLKASGYYLQAAWALTGENRSYRIDTGAFGNIKSDRPNGAWEAFVRFSQLDVSDNNFSLPEFVVNGSKGDIFTLGLNWFINRSNRASINYVYAGVDELIKNQGHGDAITARWQFVF